MVQQHVMHLPTFSCLPHGCTGKPKTLNDGTQQCKGVRVIRLRADPNGKLPTGRKVLTGGSDGCVMQWELAPVDGVRKVRVLQQ